MHVNQPHFIFVRRINLWVDKRGDDSSIMDDPILIGFIPRNSESQLKLLNVLPLAVTTSVKTVCLAKCVISFNIL